MTSGEGGSDVGSEFIFLGEEDKFLVCCLGINNFSGSLSRGRITRIVLLCPLWSCVLLKLFSHGV